MCSDDPVYTSRLISLKKVSVLTYPVIAQRGHSDPNFRVAHRDIIFTLFNTEDGETVEFKLILHVLSNTN